MGFSLCKCHEHYNLWANATFEGVENSKEYDFVVYVAAGNSNVVTRPTSKKQSQPVYYTICGE
jgi:hypothetical protein